MCDYNDKQASFNEIYQRKTYKLKWKSQKVFNFDGILKTTILKVL